MVCLESLIEIMFLISTRCLSVLVLILLPFPNRSDGTDGFPKLDDNKKIKAALEKIAREDGIRVPGFQVDVVMDCFDENAKCFAGDSITNELRLRNGYKFFGEECSSDPALNRHLFSPPSIRDFVAYPIWQRHLLDANQPLCSPFKHLQCSKTTAKCECRPGLIWKEDFFAIHFNPDAADVSDYKARRRDLEKICVFEKNKPCQMREYPGDEEIDSNALRPEQIKEGIPLAEYFPIFNVIEGCMVQPPSCGGNDCSHSLYGQRQRVCAPKNWDLGSSGNSELESFFPPNNKNGRGYQGDIELGDRCRYEYHRPLYAISDEELSDSDFWVKRSKTLDDLPQFYSQSYCDLTKLSTCSPPKLGELEGECECIPPSIPTMPIQPPPSQIIPTRIPPSCVFPEEFKKCDMTNGIIKLLRNETYTRGTKLLLNKGVENSMVGICPENFKCHTGLDIDDEMEIYCTCTNGQAGPQCLDKLTGFLMKPRVPSFPSDGKDIKEKWKSFNEFNGKAIQFEKIFKLSEGKSCDLNAEAEASTAIERIRRLDKKGTVMTKEQYKKLTATLIKLTKQHENGAGLCQRLVLRALTCNSVNKTCVTEDQKIMLEACRHLADICELEGMIIVSGKCFCDPKPEPSTTPNPPNNSTTSDKSTKSLGIVTVKTPSHFFIVGIIIIAMN